MKGAHEIKHSILSHLKRGAGFPNFSEALLYHVTSSSQEALYGTCSDSSRNYFHWTAARKSILQVYSHEA